MANGKKETSPAEKNASDVNPEQGKGETVQAEVKSSKGGDIQLQRKLYDAQKENEKKEKEIEELKKKLENKEPEKDAPLTPFGELERMRARIDELSSQVTAGYRGEKKLFRAATPADIGDEEITFTARSVYYIVGSYMDSNGLEVLPPHRLIPFVYQASDIRKDGKEETIKNFCQYTTKLKTEIDFLRRHPYYGITFSENTNEMMDEDTRDTAFKVMAANQITSLSPEGIFQRAEEYLIPNWRQKTAEQLKPIIVAKMAAVFKEEAKKLSDDILRRRILASTLIENKE